MLQVSVCSCDFLDSIVPYKGNAEDKYQPPVGYLIRTLVAVTEHNLEIRKGTLEWSMAAEVWCLGAVLYHMMVGSARSTRK
jgi:hypothetical protein